MTAVYWLAAFMAVVGVVSYLRLPLMAATILLTVVLLAWTLFGDPAIFSQLLVWPL